MAAVWDTLEVEREQENLAFVEPGVNIPIYVDGWIATERNGLIYSAYYVLVEGPHGKERMIVARHVMPCSAVKMSRMTETMAIKIAIGELTN